MRIIISKLLTLYLGLTLSLGVNSDTDCQELLNWIYKDLSVENLDLSYDRMMDKLLLGFLHVTEHLKGSRTANNQLTKIKNRLVQIEPKFQEIIDKADIHFMLDESGDLAMSTYRNPTLAEKDLMGVLVEWKRLQDSSPDLFKGLEDKYKLDHWDMLTGKVLTESVQFGQDKERYRDTLSRLGGILRKQKTNILAGMDIDINSLEENLNSSKSELMNHFRQNFIAGNEEFSSLCKEDEISKLVATENYVCLKEDEPNTSDFLNKLGLILTAKDKRGVPYFTHTKKPRIRNLVEDPLVNIHGPVYETNFSKKEATYCIRSAELVNTIVLHHAAVKASPERINQTHTNRGAPNDPWLMVGYNYMIEDEDPNWRPGMRDTDPPKVYEGRPLNYQGAHAGGRTEPLTEEQKKFYEGKIVSCGNEHIGFTDKPVLETLDKNGGLSGNLTSFGVSVLGDYTQTMEFEDIGGVQVPRVSTIASSGLDLGRILYTPDYWVRKKEKMDRVLEQVARLSCDIQKKYPNVTRIVPHQYFKDGKEGRRHTHCPGYLINHMDTIAKKAKALGCDFKIEKKR